MDSGPRIFEKIFLSFPGPPPTSYTLSFFIYKKSLKFDGGYSTCAMCYSAKGHIHTVYEIAATKMVTAVCTLGWVEFRLFYIFNKRAP
jgi:hypothetical protein